MFLIDNVTALTVRPVPAAAGAEGWFTNGDPGAGLPATIVDADFLNGVQGELKSILAAAGIDPDKTKIDQVLSAIRVLGGNLSTITVTTALALNITAAMAGRSLYFAHTTTAQTANLPAANAVQAGATLHLSAYKQVTLSAAGADVIDSRNSQAGSIVVGYGEDLQLVSDGVSVWYAVAGSTLLRTGALASSSLFGASLAGSGYQRLPSGLIVQWCIATGPAAGASSTFNWPITFPSAVYVAVATPNGTGTSGVASGLTITPTTTGGTMFNIGAGPSFAGGVYIVAFGK